MQLVTVIMLGLFVFKGSKYLVFYYTSIPSVETLFVCGSHPLFSRLS
jgi:hypothetical protein